MTAVSGEPAPVGSRSYADRRAWLTEYFDRTAATAWAKLTSDDKVSGIRATVRAGRAEMLATLAGWLPADLTGARVLDAGCGTGLLAVDLANRGADVVAIDLSPTLVGLAAERAAGRFSGGTIDWRAGDMLDPALGDFDYVVAMDSLIHYQPWDMVHAYAALAPRTRRALLVTHAPWTPVLGTLQAVGRLFPQSDRAPRIVPVHAGLLRVAVTTDRRLAGWGLGRTRRVSRGFYKSQALELVRGAGAGG